MKIHYIFFVVTSLYSIYGVPNPANNEIKSAFPNQASQALLNFSFDMFQSISDQSSEKENLFFSPFSLYISFAALLPGLDAMSKQQVEELLRYNNFNNQDAVSDMVDRVFKQNTKSYNLTNANRMYIDKRLHLLKAYKEAISGLYGYSTKKVDFAGDPDNSRRKINRDIARQTKKDIKEMMKEGTIDASTMLILTNTLQMEAKWSYPFNEKWEATDSFNINNTHLVNVKFMRNKMAQCLLQEIFALRSLLILLPMAENALSMIIIMPEEAGNFSTLENAHATNEIQRAMENIWRSRNPDLTFCDIQLPKFSVKFNVDNMKQILKAMGIRNIFNPALADFSRMTTTENLYVNDVQHAAAIEVNEHGVRASAATAVSFGFRSTPRSVRIRQPFLFFIRHKISGAILFFGKVVQPQFQE